MIKSAEETLGLEQVKDRRSQADGDRRSGLRLAPSGMSRPGVNGQNHAEFPCIMRTDGGIYADYKQRHNAGDEGRGRSCR